MKNPPVILWFRNDLRLIDNPALYNASKKGHLDVVKALLDAGAYINQANKYGQNPLYNAENKGRK